MSTSSAGRAHSEGGLIKWWQRRSAARRARIEGRHLVQGSAAHPQEEELPHPRRRGRRPPSGHQRRRGVPGAAGPRTAAQGHRHPRRRHGRSPVLRPQIDHARVRRIDRRGGGGGAPAARVRGGGLPDPLGLDDPDAGGGRPHLRLEVRLRHQRPVHEHQDPPVRRARARRRHRLQVSERSQHRLHQAGGRPAGRRHRDAGRGALHQRPSGGAAQDAAHVSLQRCPPASGLGSCRCMACWPTTTSASCGSRRSARWSTRRCWSRTGADATSVARWFRPGTCS